MNYKSTSQINDLQLNVVMTQELDKGLVQRAVTGIFADNALRAKFVGAKTVMIPNMDMQSLGDYDRDTGFVRGAVTVANEPYTLEMDRGRSFQVDREDSDETGINDLMGEIAAEFVRTKVVPEMDAYVLSKVAGLAASDGQRVEGTPDTEILKMMNDAINKVRDAAGYGEENLLAFVDPTVYAALQSTPEVQRQLVLSDFKKGDLDTKVQTLNGVAILPVSAARMKTAYTFRDGSTEGQEEGGFVPADGAMSIGFLVLPKRAVSLVKKTEKVRRFTPDQNQIADAWKLDYRVYYNAFVKKSMRNTIYTYVY